MLKMMAVNVKRIQYVNEDSDTNDNVVDDDDNNDDGGIEKDDEFEEDL